MQFSGFGLAAVFCRWCELLKFENIVSPYFEFRFHPMKWPLIFQLLRFSQPGFSSGLWRFFAAMPPWQSWGQSSWNNWRDDKNKYQFDSDEALQYPEVVTPNTWKSTSTFYDENVSFGLQFHRTIQPTNVCTAFRFFFLKSELKIQLLFCHSIRWPCFHLSKERIENPAIPAFLPFDIVDRFFFPQSGLYLLTTRHV